MTSKPYSVHATVHHLFEAESTSSYTALLADLQRRLSVDSESIVIKYRDYEGDLVTISSEQDLEEAVRLSNEFCQGDLQLLVDCVRVKNDNPAEVPVKDTKPDLSELHGRIQEMGKSASEYIRDLNVLAKDFFSQLQKLAQDQTDACVTRAAVTAPRPISTQAVQAIPPSSTNSTQFEMASAFTHDGPAAARDSVCGDVASVISMGSNSGVVSGVPRSCVEADVTVPAGTEVVAGATFTKVWRVRNMDSSAWPLDAYPQSVSDPFAQRTLTADADGTSALGVPVGYGSDAHVCVTITAPSEPGLYTGSWMLVTPAGQPLLCAPLTCEIVVVAPKPTTRRQPLSESISALSASLPSLPAIPQLPAATAPSDDFEWVMIGREDQSAVSQAHPAQAPQVETPPPVADLGDLISSPRSGVAELQEQEQEPVTGSALERSVTALTALREEASVIRDDDVSNDKEPSAVDEAIALAELLQRSLLSLPPAPEAAQPVQPAPQPQQPTPAVTETTPAIPPAPVVDAPLQVPTQPATTVPQTPAGHFWLPPLQQVSTAPAPAWARSPFETAAAPVWPAPTVYGGGPVQPQPQPPALPPRRPRTDSNQRPFPRPLPDEERFTHALQMLEEMGFRDRPRNLALLRRARNGVEEVLDQLLSSQ